ncbi:MAG: hypothetical protein ACYDEX_16285 [Mobilitalea sp.]
MVRYNKVFILIIMLIGIFLLSGCSKFHFETTKGTKKESGIEITIAPENSKRVAETNNIIDEVTTTPAPEIESTVKSTPTPAAIQPTDNIDLTVFTVSADTGDIEPVTALLPKDSEITPEVIVNTVVESMEDQSIMVGIESITTKDKAVIVSFYKDKAPIAELYAGYEAAILNAIAQSLIDNLDNYSQVIYRVEGKAYQSSFFEFDIDYVYFGDN